MGEDSSATGIYQSGLPTLRRYVGFWSLCMGPFRSTLMAPPKSQPVPTPPSTPEPTVAAPSPMATPEKPPAATPSEPSKAFQDTAVKPAPKPASIPFGTVSASAETLVLGASLDSLPSLETISSKPSTETLEATQVQDTKPVVQDTKPQLTANPEANTQVQATQPQPDPVTTFLENAIDQQIADEQQQQQSKPTHTSSVHVHCRKPGTVP